nr:MAG TPA: plasmid partition protein ParG-helix-helix, dimer, DNA binding, CELL [Caudoviricetes sp.]
MKKIIGGSRYNTETAQRLGTHENNCLPNDIYYRGQDLYRTKAGKYFIHNYGNGFPLPDGFWGWGEEITPVSEDDARQWAEEYLDGDAYEAAFGEVTEDARLNVLLPQELLDKLDARAAADGVSRSVVVRAALSAYLSGMGKAEN